MNLDPQTQTGARNRSILKIVVGLAAAGVVLGLLTGIVGASAMRAIGFNSDDTQPPASPASPASEPTEESEPTESPSTTPTADQAEQDQQDEQKDNKTPKLTASPKQASSGQRINLAGKFPELKEGEVLQVQRREAGSWEDFPVVARTNADGSFETWVVTSRSGKTKFRLKAQDSNRKTPAAAVRIG